MRIAREYRDHEARAAAARVIKTMEEELGPLSQLIERAKNTYGQGLLKLPPRPGPPPLAEEPAVAADDGAEGDG